MSVTGTMGYSATSTSTANNISHKNVPAMDVNRIDRISLAGKAALEGGIQMDAGLTGIWQAD